MVEHHIVTEEDDDIRIDRWFKRHHPNLPFGQVAKLLRTGQVRLDGKRVDASDRIHTGQSIRLPPGHLLEAPPAYQKPDAARKQAALNLKPLILYENESIIAINKPQGLATQGGSGVKTSIDDYLKNYNEEHGLKLKLIHRLDKDTSGLLILAKGAKYADQWMKQFQSKSVEKTYVAILCGYPSKPSGVLKFPLLKMTIRGQEKMAVHEEGQKAETEYEIIDHVGKNLSLAILTPRTGRTHQLRVHCAHIGHPILGDGKYGGDIEQGLGQKFKLHLHAWKISILNPKPLTISAPLPQEFLNTCKEFGLDDSLFKPRRK
ncbi:MAG: RluA family pseudouridine synthase [Alphaproteobacteria bacterium]|nr:RluA family pseudouridine synthase [Alphaproteobacteria bacterium]